MTHSDPNENDLSERKNALGQKLNQAQDSYAQNTPKDTEPKTGYGMAFRAASDFVAALFVGCVLGWGLDSMLGTKPWFLILFVLLGFAAAITTIVRTVGGGDQKLAMTKRKDTPDQDNPPASK